MTKRKDPKTTKKLGRPSKLDTVDMELLEKLCLQGLTDAQISGIIGITEQTFNNWKIKNKTFFESLKNWKTDADGKVVRSLWERALGYTHPEEQIFCQGGKVIRVKTTKHYPPDTSSMIFWLKNRQPAKWRDKHELEIKDYKHDIFEGKSYQDLESEADELAKRINRRKAAALN